MIQSFAILRCIALLKRGVCALESLADSQSRIAQVVENEWEAKHAPRKPLKTEFGVMDVEEVNRLHRLRTERENAGIQDE